MNLDYDLLTPIRHLGWRDALQLFLKLRIGRPERVKLNIDTIAQPITLRTMTSDIAAFYQVMIMKEYGLDLPLAPSRIIDAGSNIGLAAVYFANRWPGASIVCLEPHAANYEILQENVRNYQRITARKVGLWGEHASLAVRDVGLGQWGMIVEPAAPTQPSVEAVTVADLMLERNWASVDLLKMDIEGAEKEVFEGAVEEWLPYTSVLVVELHDRMKNGCSKAMFDALGRFDFSLAAPSGENLVFVNNSTKQRPFA